jgi:hypothetical protein
MTEGDVADDLALARADDVHDPMRRWREGWTQRGGRSDRTTGCW